MSRNRKPARKPARARSGGNTLIGVFIGLVFGALIAAGAAWYFTRSSPFQATPTAPALPSAEQRPSALPGRPGGQPVAKQDYEFYNILTQGDNIPAAPATPATPPPTARQPVPPPVVQQQPPAPVQEASLRPLPGSVAAVAPGPTPAPATAPAVAPQQRLYLQVGAFSSPGEADNLKARLALAGIQASAQRAELADGRVVHRVRVGPYSRAEDANPMRARLAEAGFEASVLR